MKNRKNNNFRGGWLAGWQAERVAEFLFMCLVPQSIKVLHEATK
jgi:hypothetical protein